MNESRDAELTPFEVSQPPEIAWIVRILQIGIATVVVGILVALLYPTPTRVPREYALRSHCKHNLKMIHQALKDYAEHHGKFPPLHTVDKDGRPLHSWRTLILPYLDQGTLYAKLDLSKPWNDPVNAELFGKANVSQYQCPSNAYDPKDRSKTTYLAIVTEGGAFRLEGCPQLAEITNNVGPVMLVMEVPQDRAIPWMCPLDADKIVLMQIDEKSKLAHRRGMHGLLSNGEIEFLPPTMPAERRRSLTAPLSRGS